MNSGNEIVGRIKKLLCYALDGAASDAESKNAAFRAIETARKHGVQASELFRDAAPEADRPGKPSDPWTLCFTFGRYKWETIQEVMAKNPSYCRWVYEKCKNLDESFLDALHECIHAR